MDPRGTLDLLSAEFLMCDVCQEEMTTPKELPCIHYFCLQCILRLARTSGVGAGGQIDCPTCRKSAVIPETGVEGFPTNFHIVRLQELVKERKRARRKKPPVQLVSALSAMQDTIQKAKETRDLLQRRYRNLHKHKQSCNNEIESRRTYLHSLIDDYVTSLAGKLDACYEQEMSGCLNKISIELNQNLELLEGQISSLQKIGGLNHTDPKYSPLQRLRTQLDKVTVFAGNLSTLEETVREVGTTSKTVFKSGMASAYIMEQVFGKLQSTDFTDDLASLKPRSSLANIQEIDTVTVVNYFSSSMADDENDSYITDIEALPSGEIVIIDADNHMGKIFFESGQPKLAFGQKTLKRPDKVTSLPDNLLADTAAQRKYFSILITDLEEEAIFKFDGTGKLVSKFSCPVKNPAAIACTKEGNLVLTDWKTKTVHIVSGQGEHLHTFPTDLTWPVYADVAPNSGNIVISDWKSHHVKIFDTFGTTICDYNQIGSGNGQIQRPNGVTCDRRGNIFLTDMRNSRIHLVAADGTFKRFVATSEQGIRRPTGLSINHKGELLVCDLKGTVTILSMHGQE